MNKFVEIPLEQMIEIDGGFVITGAMVATAIGCLAGGVAVGYAIGKIF